MRAADYVFETLSRAILSGELVPGSVLSTQRELSQQFGVSPLVVRQATHRLEELGLVRVRQGSTTIVLDPNEATDIRLMELQLELATPGDRFGLAAMEMQALSTLSLLALAERRISSEELDALEKLIETYPESPTRHEMLAFRVQFWGRIARATHNPVVEHQIRWWARLSQELEKRQSGNRDAQATQATQERPPTLPGRATYRSLARCLRKRRGSVDAWLKVIVHLFDWTESRPNHPVNEALSTRARADRQSR